MVSPARQIRNVERDYIDPRPRDRAIRARRNAKRTSYPIRSQRVQDPAYPTVDQQFADSYSQQGIQPSLPTTSPTRNTALTRKNFTLAPAQPSTTTKTKRRFTETPDTYIPAARRQRRRDFTQRFHQQHQHTALTAKTVFKKARATQVSVMIICAASSIYVSVQFPAAVIATVFLGASVMVETLRAEIENYTGKIILGVLEFIATGLNDLVAQITGFDLLSLLDPIVFFMLAHLVATFMGIATLIGAALAYQVSLINCLGGKEAGKKISAFVMALALYMIPLVNIFPVGLVWMYIVWKNPE
jgi:hypothetical protein